MRVVEILRERFDFVVVDTSPAFDDALVSVLEYTDDALLLVNPDAPGAKNSRIALDTLRAMGFDLDRVHVIVNQTRRDGDLDLAELEEALGERVAATIPADELAQAAGDEGAPLVAPGPESRADKAFQALARMFLQA
jgi:pilus assembly protein CpaE